ncbi:AcrR family transcriptional regulator [Saccharopolyspora phatthalungensis]|uniref:AcrR family transcriptional regulator n=2 Tax=Saccharopolyspora phatthalungensis TaxID=664693 RepID=A0A840QK54_9PSEU|nr:TetR/AcrR family transcriptional regulator [Saccharopolyspora phatthalungensis]MBB5159739.1 AcrR family transcriptional regulator [Saccharopolyspora phatthalungensis]
MSTGARRQRLEPDQRRTQILAVARRLFARGSYSSVSTSDIARAAGVTRPLINHYFGGKRQLYLEIVREMLVTPGSVSEDLPRTTPRERIAIVVDRWIDVVDRDREMWLSAIDEGIGRDEDLDRVLLESDEMAADLVLEAAMMTDVVEGREQLRAMIRAYGTMLKAASREWLVRGTLSRGDLHILLTQSALHLLQTVYPAVRDQAPLDQAT